MDRGAVWKRLGAPRDQMGSVNDPRTYDECGVRWNEKWLYADPEGEGWDRIVLWNRYDLLGVFRIDSGGTYHPDPCLTRGRT